MCEPPRSPVNLDLRKEMSLDVRRINSISKHYAEAVHLKEQVMSSTHARALMHDTYITG